MFRNRAQTIAAAMIFPNGNTIEKTIIDEAEEILLVDQQLPGCLQDGKPVCEDDEVTHFDYRQKNPEPQKQ